MQSFTLTASETLREKGRWKEWKEVQKIKINFEIFECLYITSFKNDLVDGCTHALLHLRHLKWQGYICWGHGWISTSASRGCKKQTHGRRRQKLLVDRGVHLYAFFPIQFPPGNPNWLTNPGSKMKGFDEALSFYIYKTMLL